VVVPVFNTNPLKATVDGIFAYTLVLVLASKTAEYKSEKKNI